MVQDLFFGGCFILLYVDNYCENIPLAASALNLKQHTMQFVSTASL